MPIYMQIDGIKGDATEEGHKEWLRVDSVQFGVGRAIATPVGAAKDRETSQPSVSDITVSRPQDGASAQLFQEACVGNKGKTVQIDFLTTGDPAETYFTIKLTNTLVANYSLSSGGDKPTEALSLNFTKIEYDYKGSKEDRTAGGQKRAAFDLGLGKSA